MKFKSHLVTAASGSTGGTTYASNQGGLYTRARSRPTNPRSSFQTAVRNAVQLLTTRWASTLTAAQRLAWTTYQTNVTFPDAFGDPRKIGPLGCYIRSNVPRLQAGKSIVDAGPTTYDTGTFTSPVPTIVAAGTTVSLAFTAADAWATEVGGFMFLYASRPVSGAINFFAGPFRFAAAIVGAVSPPSSPAVITLPFPIGVAGTKMFFQVRVARADGRLSSTWRGSATA